MTYQSALSHTEGADHSFIRRSFSRIVRFLNSLTVRLIAIFVVGTMLSALVVDFVYPKLQESSADKVVVMLAEHARSKSPTGSDILQTINQYNLAWYYMTTPDGKVLPLTRPFAPYLSKYGITAREVDWRGKHYYEAVESIKDGQALHIGFYAGPIILPGVTLGLTALGTGAFSIPVSLGYALYFAFGLMLVVLFGLQLWVGQPLVHLARACYSLLLTREAYSHITGGGLRVPGAVTEVQNVSKGLRDIRRQYDEAVMAKTAKEEQLKRTRVEHREEKTIISKQYEDQLAQSEAKISELHTKEAEEEFINSLERELDALKSSKQIYQRVLEKLNDKFPTSIIYGGFFKINKSAEYSLEAFLGFDESMVQVLKKIDHAPIARNVFAGGQHLHMGSSELREYGFQQLVQNCSIRNVVYLPVKFQERKLGMLAFYFVQESQTVQERLRVLRNVVDLVSRTLNQVILYEEEKDSALTDSLTGLRNKKFFYEIMPQVFERAASKPEEHPISLIMIDGDHFKSINDTFGHQSGDLMLKELARVIKGSVRTNDSLDRTSGSGDYLARVGGEEFVVVMENADINRAMAVAERIRQAVEHKADWPGGIPKWTISLGVATYPSDGKSADELIANSDMALYYVKDELGRNKSCHYQQVPKEFKNKKIAAAMAGELGVFDGAGLLQSIATSQKTGVLTVSSGGGRQLWMLFENGKPVQARMGKMNGNAAIVDFVVTYEEGSFTFQERITDGKETKLPRLADECNVTKSLDRCLMDGALAQDNFIASKKILPSTEIYIRPAPKPDFDIKMAAIKGRGEDGQPTADEWKQMQKILEVADGQIILTKIFKQLEPTPVYILWRAAALLAQFGLIQIKRV